MDTPSIALSTADTSARRLTWLLHTRFQARYLAKATANQGRRSVALASNPPRCRPIRTSRSGSSNPRTARYPGTRGLDAV